MASELEAPFNWTSVVLKQLKRASSSKCSPTFNWTSVVLKQDRMRSRLRRGSILLIGPVWY